MTFFPSSFILEDQILLPPWSSGPQSPTTDQDHGFTDTPVTKKTAPALW